MTTKAVTSVDITTVDGGHLVHGLAPVPRTLMRGARSQLEWLRAPLSCATWDGPRADVPAAIWKVVDLAATSAGDVGITYVPPGRA